MRYKFRLDAHIHTLKSNSSFNESRVCTDKSCDLSNFYPAILSPICNSFRSVYNPKLFFNIVLIKENLNIINILSSFLSSTRTCNFMYEVRTLYEDSRYKTRGINVRKKESVEHM